MNWKFWKKEVIDYYSETDYNYNERMCEKINPSIKYIEILLSKYNHAPTPELKKEIDMRIVNTLLDLSKECCRNNVELQKLHQKIYQLENK